MIETLRFAGLVAAGLFTFFIASAYASDQKTAVFFNPQARDRLPENKLKSLRIVTIDDFAPFSSFTKDGKLNGVHVDLAKAICAELKVADSCTLQAVAFGDVVNLLLSEQADVALAGLVPSEENRKILAFSVPYFRYPSKFLMQTGQSLATIEAVGVVANSQHQKLATALFPKIKQTLYANNQEALLALISGTIKALFDDGLRLASKKAAEPALGCCQLSSENYYLPAIRFDTLSATNSAKRPELSIAINNAMRRLATDGRLEEIFLRHLPIDLRQ